MKTIVPASLLFVFAIFGTVAAEDLTAPSQQSLGNAPTSASFVALQQPERIET